jgi:methanogen extracellular protein (TIGR04279 family)
MIVLASSVVGMSPPTASALDPMPSGSIRIEDGEIIDEIVFADHSSDLEEGNWVVVTGGTVTFDLPSPATIKLMGAEESVREYEDVTVTITGKSTERTITAPGDKLHAWYMVANPTISFYGNDMYAGDHVDIRVLSATERELLDAYEDLKEGNVDTLRTLFSDSVVDSQSVELDDNGDALNKVFGTFFAQDPLSGGDYVVVVLDEVVEENYNKLTIYGAAPILVLESEIIVEATYNDEYPSLGIDLDITVDDERTDFDLWSYASLLIREDAYSLYSEVTSDGTVVKVRNMGNDHKALTTVVTGGEIMGVPWADYEDLINPAKANALLSDLYNEDEYHLGTNIKSSLKNNVPITLVTDGFLGTYVMTTFVYEHGSDHRIIGIDQQTVTFVTPERARLLW